MDNLQDMYTLFIVPAIGAVVLSALLVSWNRSSRSLGLGAVGLLGVVLGGPGTILLLGPGATLAEEKDEIVAKPKPRTSGAADPQQSSGTSTNSLSGKRIIYADDRPQWVYEPPEQIDGVEAVYVESGPYKTRSECYRAFDRRLVEATSQFIEEHLNNKYAKTLLRYNATDIKDRFLNAEFIYDEMVEFPTLGPMHQKHALALFGPSFRDELDGKWQEVVARGRLLQTALIGGSVLALLSVLFCYFRVDTATRGFYSGRLQFVAVAAILALIAAGVLVARWIPWI